MYYYVTFAGLQVRIQSSPEWYKYLNKLYDTHTSIACSKKPFNKKTNGVLIIREKKSSLISFKVNIHSGLQKHTIYASNHPIFLYLTVHQYICRIFNILFHLKGGFVLHGSSILTKNGVIIFMGQSGSGKSTAVDYMHDKHPKYPILSDNSAFIMKGSNHTFVLYPSPYLESNRIYRHQTTEIPKSPYRVRMVFVPKHAVFNKITVLKHEDKVQYFQKHSHIPFRPDVLFNKKQCRSFGKTMFDFIDAVPVYRLEFEKGSEFIPLILKYVKQKNKIL